MLAALCRNELSKSMGNGKMIVEFFSALNTRSLRKGDESQVRT